MATANTIAAFASIRKAQIIDPKTMKGLLRVRRRKIFRPFCVCCTSLVMRLISVSVPIRSRL